MTGPGMPGVKKVLFPERADKLHMNCTPPLHNAGIEGPYILVGQSFGGFLVRSFARFYKDEVAGMVLVDALNENEKININNQAVRIRDMAKGRKEPEIQKTAHKNTNAGLANEENPVASNTILEPPLDKLSLDDQKMQLWAQTQLSYFKAVSNEMDWSPEDVANMYENRGKPEYMLGNIPVIILSKGKGNYGSLPDSVELEKQRLDLQKDLAHLSTNSKNIVVRNSGHNIHLENPAIVIDAIIQVITAYKTKTKLK